MSDSKYPNMFQFIKNILSSYILSIKNIFNFGSTKLRNSIQITDTKIDTEFQQLDTYITQSESTIRNDLTNLETTVTNARIVENTKLQNHQNNTNNPHQVKFVQMSVISQYQPTSGQGVNGDVWVEYLN